jgi:alpha-L-fucosidase 2
MNYLSKVFPLFVLGIFIMGKDLAQPIKHPLRLWYKQPALRWTDALPIGNGKMGAMIFGGIAEDHLQFNEATLWTGRPREHQRNGAWQYLDSIRQLLFAGKQKEAEALAEKRFMGRKYPDDSLYVIQRKEWLQKMESDSLLAGVDTNNVIWNTMPVPTPEGWERAGYEGLDGVVWMRNDFELPAAMQGKNLIIDLGRIRDKDITYVNGVRIGSMESTTDRRRYTIPASTLKTGQNKIAIQVINFYDKGGLIGVKNNSRTLCVYPEGGGDTINLNPIWMYFIQDKNPPQFPQYEASYQPFGDVYFKYNHSDGATNYQRQLNIENAIATTSYSDKGIRFTREYFANAPGNFVATHVTASKPKSISVTAYFKTPHQEYTIQKANNSIVSLYVKVKGGELYGVSYLMVNAKGGKTIITDTGITVNNADEATFYFTAATNFIDYKTVSGNPDAVCKQALQKLAGKTYISLKAEHIKDYQSLFNRYSITLSATANTALPTDERVQKFTPQTDPSLLALYQQYGRYLLISSSRPGGQPANLQGIWNDQLTPSWGSKYTTNINLQMNYWPAELLNLSECAAPLWPMLNELSASGSLTAKEHYNAPGWVLHHNTDLWRGTAPINASNHGVWQTGGAWLSQHIWEHYLFTRDVAFLKKYYPIMRGAAEFFAATLVKDPVTGYLISTPSNSPEHGGMVAGPTMDHQIIRQLFEKCVTSATILQTDAEFSKQLQVIIPQLAPNKIGKHGQLQEWMQDIDDPTDTHRHVSHLIPEQILPGTTQR